MVSNYGLLLTAEELHRLCINAGAVMTGKIERNVVQGVSRIRLLGGVLLLFVMSGTGIDVARAGFDQNRLFIGLNRKINRYVSMDIGYQSQSINTPGPRVADVMNHILLIQWFIDWTD